MPSFSFRRFAPALLLLACVLPPLAQADAALDQIIAGPQRSEAHRARDVYRHPAETLNFFGLKPDQTVLEIWPGGGWYTEILAPYLREHGRYYAAQVAPSDNAERNGEIDAFEAKLASDHELYRNVAVETLSPPQFTDIRPAGGADLIVTFRNIHNWLKDGTAQDSFKAFYTALKSGGILGVEEHRAAPGTSLEQMIKTGYVTEELVIKLAKDAGFVLAAKAEINANPKDTKDYPKGVWTLPPGYAAGALDHERYQAIGESDRMTLKFIKPGAIAK
ncbi:methyltransferase [Silvimonas sp.]|uniref:class I SAM-dependent methyltransferase n=1 Tax=Silvimonas sp. TaxID=2650811 RepID=UPI00284837CB|nr:methyltransferase [Silvimonas sp.]MDR3426182.1 methyltransferase [Silvimonas sp.]